VTIANRGGGPFGWALVANHPQPPSSRYTYVPSGLVPVGQPFEGPGYYPVKIDGFVDTDRDGTHDDTEPFMVKSTSVRILQQSTLTIAGPAQTKPWHGVYISTTATRADWATNQNVPLADRQVFFQWRQARRTCWRTLAVQRTDGSGVAKAFVRVPIDGDFRVAFPGDEASGSSNSPAMHVAIVR
jgi:hypothetical protein